MNCMDYKIRKTHDENIIILVCYEFEKTGARKNELRGDYCAVSIAKARASFAKIEAC